jgi:hypothetical protein
MKLTTTQLKRIIKEEVEKAIHEMEAADEETDLDLQDLQLMDDLMSKMSPAQRKEFARKAAEAAELGSAEFDPEI